jgi:hypothetical protein
MSGDLLMVIVRLESEIWIRTMWELESSKIDQDSSCMDTASQDERCAITSIRLLCSYFPQLDISDPCGQCPASHVRQVCNFPSRQDLLSLNGLCFCLRPYVQDET